MRITLDVSPAVQRRAGLGRYAEKLTHALISLESEDEIRVFYLNDKGKAPAPPLNTLPHRTLDWSTKRWRLSVLLSSSLRIPLNGLLGTTDVFHATDQRHCQLRPTARADLGSAMGRELLPGPHLIGSDP